MGYYRNYHRLVVVNGHKRRRIKITKQQRKEYNSRLLWLLKENKKQLKDNNSQLLKLLRNTWIFSYIKFI